MKAKPEVAKHILVDKKTGERIALGAQVTTFDGAVGTVIGWQAPHSPASTGRVFLEMPGGFKPAYYPSVIGAEIRKETK